MAGFPATTSSRGFSGGFCSDASSGSWLWSSACSNMSAKMSTSVSFAERWTTLPSGAGGSGRNSRSGPRPPQMPCSSLPTPPSPALTALGSSSTVSLRAARRAAAVRGRLLTQRWLPQAAQASAASLFRSVHAGHAHWSSRRCFFASGLGSRGSTTTTPEVFLPGVERKLSQATHRIASASLTRVQAGHAHPGSHANSSSSWGSMAVWLKA
mmetsp:Transcript_50959/g.95356  ORF Transcript_50959/g.95356 Transcript_50959/m.95356 type:complete len:211 (+) Transcript_50959:333-965(+)